DLRSHVGTGICDERRVGAEDASVPGADRSFWGRIADHQSSTPRMAHGDPTGGGASSASVFADERSPLPPLATGSPQAETVVASAAARAIAGAGVGALREASNSITK